MESADYRPIKSQFYAGDFSLKITHPAEFSAGCVTCKSNYHSPLGVLVGVGVLLGVGVLVIVGVVYVPVGVTVSVPVAVLVGLGVEVGRVGRGVMVGRGVDVGTMVENTGILAVSPSEMS